MIDPAEIRSLESRVAAALPPGIVEELQRAGMQLILRSSSDAPPGVYHPVMLDQTIADELQDLEALEEMGSYETDTTGIHNTVFISPRAGARHAARIKVAIDPPTRFDPRQGETASIAVHNGEVMDGDVPSRLQTQLREFIDLNRQALLDYWDYKISTTEMERRLRPIGT